MTLVVGYNFGQYALIGADTRVCYYIRNNVQFRDDEEKLQRTQIGLITGAGLCQLLDPVKEMLDQDGQEHTDQIKQYVKQARDDFEQTFHHDDERVREALDTTAWMFTYVARTDDSFTLRLAILSSERNANIGYFPANSGGILAPSGATDEQQKEWQQFLMETIKPYEQDLTDINDHASHHAAMIRALMTEVASLNDGVAESFQLGIHLMPMNIGISGICFPPDFSAPWGWGPE